MESNLVDNSIDNQFPIDNNKALVIIKDFFKNELPHFILINFFNKGNYSGFDIKFKSNEIEINIRSPKGGLEYDVFVGGRQYALKDYDERLNRVYICSEKNLRIVLSVFKQFALDKSDNKTD